MHMHILIYSYSIYTVHSHTYINFKYFMALLRSSVFSKVIVMSYIHTYIHTYIYLKKHTYITQFFIQQAILINLFAIRWLSYHRGVWLLLSILFPSCWRSPPSSGSSKHIPLVRIFKAAWICVHEVLLLGSYQLNFFRIIVVCFYLS